MFSQDATQSSRKRPRSDDPDDNTDESAKVEHPSLYYDDGNVILSCENMVFRVHRSVLSKNSPVFREMLETRTKGEEDRKPDVLSGCLRIALDHTKEDVETLLKIVYNDLRVDHLRLAADELSLVTSIFRMAMKYRIERTLTEIYTLIRRKWPSDLDAHDARIMLEQRNGLSQVPRICGGIGGGGPATNVLGDPIAVQKASQLIHPARIIILLREDGCNDVAVLTPLFYALTCAEVKVDEHDRALEELPRADIARFVRGLEQIREHHSRAVLSIPAVDSFGLLGSHVGQCWPGMRLLWAELGRVWLDDGRMFASSRQPVETWGLMLKPTPTQFARYSICNECSQKLIARMHDMRKGLWSKLPSYFGLI